MFLFGSAGMQQNLNKHVFLLLVFVLWTAESAAAEQQTTDEEVVVSGKAAHAEANADNLVSSRSHIWGPGLTIGSSNTPVRYFFLHAVHKESGLNFTTSPGVGSISVEFRDENSNKVRLGKDVFDRRDGSLVVRYRLFASYRSLRIAVLNTAGEHIAKSPYSLEQVLDENCACPAEFAAFKKSFRCPAEGYKQVDVDLARFGAVNLSSTIPETIRRFSDQQGACFAHYSVVNNKLYAKVHGPHTGFRMFSDAFLSSLVRKVQLPDVEFIVNLGDYPQETRLDSDDKLPVFSWCGSTKHADIVMPTYDVTQATVDSMTRVHRDMLSSQERQEAVDWPRKIAKAFWRGRDSRQERLDLARLSKRHPDMIDARLTNFFFFREQEEELGRAAYTAFSQFFEYKYQINLDGTVAAYRFPWLLAGGSAVLKQESQYYEHFYSDLVPWTHYVPVKRDLSNLLTQIQWLKDNEEKAKEIAANAVELTRRNLMPESIYCYYAMLFEQYAAKLTTVPTVHEGMLEVEQPGSRCNCDQAASPRDEL